MKTCKPDDRDQFTLVGGANHLMPENFFSEYNWLFIGCTCNISWTLISCKQDHERWRYKSGQKIKKTKSKKDMRSIRQDLIQIPCVSDPSIYAIGAQFAYDIGGRLRSPIGVRYWTSRHWPSSPFWWHLGDFHTHWVQASIRSPRLTWSRRKIDHQVCDISNDMVFCFISRSPSSSSLSSSLLPSSCHNNWMRQTKRASGWSHRRGRAVQVPLSNAWSGG